MKTTGETVRDSLSFIEKLNGKEIVELENAIDEVLTELLKETYTTAKRETLREVREILTKEHYGLSYESDKCVECCNNIRIDEALTHIEPELTK